MRIVSAEFSAGDSSHAIVIVAKPDRARVCLSQAR